MQVKEKEIVCVLKDKLSVANNTVTLRFETIGKEVFAFKSGQYVVVSTKETGPNGTTGKMYTISSIPSLPALDITIRKMGAFSSVLHDLNIDDKVIITGPYGDLRPREDSERVVFIAGGIGITPFYSLIQYYVREKNSQPKQVTVIYTNRTRADAAFLQELNDLAMTWDGLKIVNTFTRENVDEKIGENGRIDEKLIKGYVKNFFQCEYFICGSIDFSDSMWRMLGKMGIPEERIFIETFY